MQGESRRDLSPCDSEHGIFYPGGRYSDDALAGWYGNRFPGFLEEISDLISAEAGDGCINALILSGSFASGEGSVIIEGDTPVFLSDIDLLLVVGDRRSHESLFRRRAVIGRACEDRLPGARFLGRIDLGVMLSEELSSQPPSPGFFDMRRKGIVLRGKREVLELLPGFEETEIGGPETMKLLENRGAAFLGAAPSKDLPEGDDLLLFLYGISRVYTDIVTALLCSLGLYRTGYMDRALFLKDSTDAAEARRLLGERLVATACKWTEFKTDPVIGDVWRRDDSAKAMWIEAASDLLEVCGSMDAPRRSVSAGRMRIMDGLRAWRRAVEGLGPLDRLRAITRGISDGLEPERRLRIESMRLLSSAVEEGTSCIVGPAPGGYPHGRTSWVRAAALTFSAWRRLVSGRGNEPFD